MNSIYTISLNSPWFELVKLGTKKYEGRRCTPKIDSLKPGDIINVKHHTDTSIEPYQVRIISIHKFQTFEEALNTLPISEVLPISDQYPYIDVKLGIDIYKQFVSIQTQLKDGISMLKVEIVWSILVIINIISVTDIYICKYMDLA